MANYFAEMVAPELAEDSIWKSVWEWLEPRLEKAVESLVLSLLGVGFLGFILKLLWSTIVQHWGYLFEYEDKVQLMKRKMEFLEARRKNEVEDKQKKGMVADVYKWLEDVEKVKKKVDGIPADVPNLLNLYSRGKVVAESILMIDSLISHPKFEWHKEQYYKIKVPPKRASNSKSSLAPYAGLESRNLTFKEVWEALQKSDVRRIGIWGPGGVGKTTMKDALKKAATDMSLFDYIVDVEVGQGQDLKKVQDSLLDSLGIDGEQMTNEDKRGKKLHEEIGQGQVLKEVQESPVDRLGIDGEQMTNEDKRREKLRDEFNKLINKDDKSKEKGKSNDSRSKKILVILDNMYEWLELGLLGLDSLAKNDYFKLLLTTRDQSVCEDMGVKGDAMFEMKSMSTEEAWFLLQQSTYISENSDTSRELEKRGQEIVELCGRLPIAIKLIAGSLIKNKKIEAWRKVLEELEKGSTPKQEFNVFGVRFLNLRKECQQMFLLCCFFPPDHDISHEDLVRYGVGLQLFDGMSFTDIRDRVQNLINELKSANFLDIGKSECFELHDLVREFGRQHVPDDIDATPLAKWTKAGDDYLKFFKLLGRRNGLVFTDDFYVVMRNLEGLAQKYNIDGPLPCGSHQNFNSLQSLSFNTFWMGNIQKIGYLSDLKILSLADSDITSLPANIGELSELILLDLSGCSFLRIHDDVLCRLQKLEEVYMGANDYRSGPRLTESNISELSQISGNLKILEFDFHGDMSKVKAPNFAKLKRFRISFGSKWLSRSYNQLGNSLNLDMEKQFLLACNIDMIFESTEILVLEVCNLVHLSEFSEQAIERRQPTGKLCSFKCLRELELRNCKHLKFFWLSMADDLEKLEILTISDSEILKEIVVGRNSGDTVRKTNFPNLRELCLKNLPELEAFCGDVEVELPQLEVLELERLPKITCIFSESCLDNSNSSDWLPSLFNQQVTISKLETLRIYEMENLENIWSLQFHKQSVCVPRKMGVTECNKLKNIFSANLIEHLQNLEKLGVGYCSSLEVVFNLQQVAGKKVSVLRQTDTTCCSVFVWKKILRFFSCQWGQTPSAACLPLRSIDIVGCDNFRHLFNPSSILDNLLQLDHLEIRRCNKFKEIDSNESIEESDPTYGRCEGRNNRDCVIHIKPDINLMRSSIWCPRSDSREMRLIDNEGIVTVLPLHLIPRFRHLKELVVHNCGSVEEVFDMEIENWVVAASNSKAVLEVLNDLERLELEDLGSMTHVWKCWKNSFPVNCFQRLTHLRIRVCPSLEYLFTTSIAKALVGLKELGIYKCEMMHKLVSEGEGNEIDKNLSFFPNLVTLHLSRLINLKCIDGGTHEDGGSSREASSSTSFSKKLERTPELETVVTSLCNSAIIKMFRCYSLSYAIPYFAVKKLEKLEELIICNCRGMKEVFQSQNIDGEQNEITIGKLSIMLLEGLDVLECICRSRVRLVLPLLKILIIDRCPKLTHVFNLSTANALENLEDLEISCCDNLVEIVKDEHEGREATSTIEFRKLRSLKLEDLKSFSGVSLGNHAFEWPLLETVEVEGCPKLAIYSSSEYSLEKHLISDPATAQELGSSAASVKIDQAQVTAATWSLYGIGTMKMKVRACCSLLNVFPSTAVLKPKYLEELKKSKCDSLKEVFQAEAIEVHSLNLQKMWPINLKEVHIWYCNGLVYLFSHSMAASLINLENLEISECSNMKSVVAELGEDEAALATNGMATDLFPKLKTLKLEHLISLSVFSFGMRKGFQQLLSLEKVMIDNCPDMIPQFYRQELVNGDQTELATTWFSCKPREIRLERCRWLRHVFPPISLLEQPNLEKLHVTTCGCTISLFEELEQPDHIKDDVLQSAVMKMPNLREMTLEFLAIMCLWSPKWTIQLPQLRKVCLRYCCSLRHVFSISTFCSLLQLEVLEIIGCEFLETIVEGRIEFEAGMNEIVLPHLRSVTIEYCSKLQNFCSGNEAFRWPSLDKLKIIQFNKLATFTKGLLATPSLKEVQTYDGNHLLEDKDLNNFLKTKWEKLQGQYQWQLSTTRHIFEGDSQNRNVDMGESSSGINIWDVASEQSMAHSMPMYPLGAPYIVPHQAGSSYQQQLVWSNFVEPIVQQGQQSQYLSRRHVAGPVQQYQPFFPTMQQQMHGGHMSSYLAYNLPHSHVPLVTGNMIPIQYDMGSVLPPDAAVAQPIPITAFATALANASPEQQRTMLFHKLYRLIYHLEHEYAADITDMLLKMDQRQVLQLLVSPDALKDKVAETMQVLRNIQ